MSHIIPKLNDNVKKVMEHSTEEACRERQRCSSVTSAEKSV